MHGIARNPITSVCYLRLLAAGCRQFLGIPSDSMDFLAFQRVPCNSFESNAIPWTSMEYYGMPSTSMELYRFLWISMELYGILWNPMGGGWEDPWESHGLQQWIIHRWQEVSKEFYNTLVESIESHGTPWLHGIAEEPENIYFLICGCPLPAMEFCGIPWNSLKPNRIPWKSKDCCGIPWNSWNSIDFH